MISQINWSVGVNAKAIEEAGFYVDDSTIPTNEIFIYEGCEDDWEVHRVKLIQNGSTHIFTGDDFFESLNSDQNSFSGKSELSKLILKMAWWTWKDEMEAGDDVNFILNEGEDHCGEINVEGIFEDISKNQNEVVLAFSRRYAGGLSLDDIPEAVDVPEDFEHIARVDSAAIYCKK
jgi:hypothetical protein